MRRKLDLDVPCPVKRCGAAKGQRCKGLRGNKVHFGRRVWYLMQLRPRELERAIKHGPGDRLMRQRADSGGKPGPRPCPRCGCLFVEAFECNCGAVHDDHCKNCGRWVSLPVDQHVELTCEAPGPCAAAEAPHCHVPMYQPRLGERWERLN